MVTLGSAPLHERRLQRIEQIWHRLTHPPLVGLAIKIHHLDEEIIRLQYNKEADVTRVRAERAQLVGESSEGQEIAALLKESFELVEALQAEAGAAHTHKVTVQGEPQRTEAFESATEVQIALEEAEDAVSAGQRRLVSLCMQQQQGRRRGSSTPRAHSSAPLVRVHDEDALGKSGRALLGRFGYRQRARYFRVGY